MEMAMHGQRIKFSDQKKKKKEIIIIQKRCVYYSEASWCFPENQKNGTLKTTSSPMPLSCVFPKNLKCTLQESYTHFSAGPF